MAVERGGGRTHGYKIHTGKEWLCRLADSDHFKDWVQSVVYCVSKELDLNLKYDLECLFIYFYHGFFVNGLFISMRSLPRAVYARDHTKRTARCVLALALVMGNVSSNYSSLCPILDAMPLSHLLVTDRHCCINSEWSEWTITWLLPLLIKFT